MRTQKPSRRTRWVRSSAPETMAAIRRAALRCFARSGVDGSTTRDIAGETGLTEGALYRHFASKDQIAQAVFEECARMLVSRLEAGLAAAAGFPAKVRALVRGFEEFARDEEASFKLLAQDHFSRVSLLPRGTRLPKDVVLELCRTAPAGLPAGDPALAAAFVIGIILRSIQFRLSGLLTLGEERFVAEVGRACLRVLEIGDDTND